ncbi:MAG: hydantoinase/carbamoylase family amidase [Alphaproteobacteria bacterium]|nr:hydantoinase/carbamoylase family amidase [Alphaproteobacteria bacterium]
MENLRIDGQRLWDSLMEMARIGATKKGGVCRLALTDLDKQSRDLFIAWCEQAGCRVSVDPVGNIFARRPGRDNALPPVVTGSHLDSQPTGGKFDGAYGVLAGLEVLRALNDGAVETEAPVEVAVWTNEEGSRFAPAMMGSGVYAGLFPLEDIYAAEDVEGNNFGAELERIGYKGAARGAPAIGAYFEAHIEQGPILEAEQRTIGIVTGAQGQRWYEITLTGMEAHAGPTPMARRRDALVGAAQVVQTVNRIGHDFQPYACATVGMMQVHPNSRNVIPGRVFMTVDFRHPDDARLGAMDAALRQEAAAIAEQCKLELELKQILDFQATPFDAGCVAAVRAGAERFGYSHSDIISGAGHDAVYVAKIAPAGMIFVPCEDGISHNEIENATLEDLAAGCQVLLHAVLDKAGAR